MERWNKEAAWKWWDEHDWPVGANYVTSDAVNDIEMWMNDTFNPKLIDKELGWAADIGFNTVRVFLSYVVWQHEQAVFENNFETFLRLAAKNQLTVLPILFDDCAFDFGSEPVYGQQPEPVPGVHNSRWVPSPGFAVQDDPVQFALCQDYVDAIVGKHAKDERIFAWDLYNEPGNTGRFAKCLPLLTAVFDWARAHHPVQPLTAGVWTFAEDEEKVNRFCWENSDIISLHAYTDLDRTKQLIAQAKDHGRPVMITEWLHRPNKNTIEDHLPFFHEEKIGIWQWGLVRGKTQTNLSWNTMNGGTPEPDPVLWQHDVLQSDGTAYCSAEIELYKKLTGK